jgi:hypothetical protein
MLSLLFAMACTAGDTGSTGDSGVGDSGTGDSGTTQDTEPPVTEITDTQDLYGTFPAVEAPLPEFAALNQLGEPRGPDDLVGHATVIWFYPLADTPG